MQSLEIGLLLLSASFAAGLTFLIRRHALRIGMLDVPNIRSSHALPTPRGGGLAIVMIIIVGTVFLACGHWVEPGTSISLTVPAAMTAAIGYLDDRHGLPALPRFAVHVTAAVAAVVMLLPSLPGWNAEAPLHWLGGLVLVLGICWSINLFNFMDGIDGIAASEAVFIALASALLAQQPGVENFSLLPLLTAGASLGFLAWNWPAAKIFMGDVGSGFLGFWLAVMALGMHVSGVLELWTSIILGAIFIADATVTLLRRMLRGDRWREPHRSHAYQHLNQRWGSHLKVTALVWAINLVILLPLAYASTVWPDASAWIAAGALVVLAMGCTTLGAGKPAN